jgi:Tol biopolymer transport system component
MKYGKILVTVLAVAAANSLAGVPQPYNFQFSSDGSKIVYRMTENGYPYIYTVNADGSGKVKLDLPTGLWGEPYLSPDGKKVAFITDDEFLNGNIFVADVDGQNLRQLTKYGDDPFEKRSRLEERVGVLDDGLTFSPDGLTVLYISEEFGSQDIFSVNVDGTGKTRLTAFAGYDELTPVFLPGGEEILFEAHGRGEEAGIWVMNADGSGKRRLFAGFGTDVLAVSPDGKKLAYADCRGDERGAYVANLDGSGRFKIADEGPSWLSLSFSPDGKKVLYCGLGVNYVVDADGSGRKALAPEWDDVSDAAFFAGGAKIAFSGARDFGEDPAAIFTLNADGSNLKPFKAKEGVHAYDLVVSPTGDRFLFRTYYYDEANYSYANYSYVIVNADGSGLVRLTGE